MKRQIRTPDNCKDCAEAYPVKLGWEVIGQVVRLKGQKRYWFKRDQQKEWADKPVASQEMAEQALCNQWRAAVRLELRAEAVYAVKEELRQAREELAESRLNERAEGLTASDLAEALAERLTERGHVDRNEIADTLSDLQEAFNGRLNFNDVVEMAKECGVTRRDINDSSGGTPVRGDIPDLVDRLAETWRHFKDIERIRPELDRITECVTYDGPGTCMYFD